MVGAPVGPLSYTLFGDCWAIQADTAVRRAHGHAQHGRQLAIRKLVAAAESEHRPKRSYRASLGYLPSRVSVEAGPVVVGAISE